MFTGIVEGIGTIAELEQGDRSVELALAVGELACGVKVGDSVALDGCCLTVTQVSEGRLVFQAVHETLTCTALGGKRVGSRVNVERALAASGRLDGHIVQGHVDGTGRVRDLLREGDDVCLTVECTAEIGELLVPKGSVAVDGVSLTVVDPGPASFSVALVPHTLAVTTLGEREPGDRVNLEADVLGKYVRRYLERLRIAAPL